MANCYEESSKRTTQLAFRKDGSLLVTGRTGVTAYDVETGQTRQSLGTSSPMRRSEVLVIDPQCDVLAYTISSKQLGNQAPHEVVVSSLQNGHIRYHQTTRDVPRMMAVSPNGEHAAICFRRRAGGVLLASLNADIEAFPLADHASETLFARFSPRQSRFGNSERRWCGPFLGRDEW